MQAELGGLDEKADSRADLTGRIRELLKLDPMPRELFVLAVERIEVGEKDKTTGQQAVHIKWKF